MIRTNLTTALGTLVPLLALVLSWPAQGAEPVRIAVSRTPLSTPLFVADERGSFAAEGLRVPLTEVIGGHRALTTLLAGDADFAHPSTSDHFCIDSPGISPQSMEPAVERNLQRSRNRTERLESLVSDLLHYAEETRATASGIGLTVARRLVERHGGTIGVETPVRDGRGSRFFFRRPHAVGTGHTRRDVA